VPAIHVMLKTVLHKLKELHCGQKNLNNIQFEIVIKVKLSTLDTKICKG
jgi:hypothetical protein